jgi:hypothetical protein
VATPPEREEGPRVDDHWAALLGAINRIDNRLNEQGQAIGTLTDGFTTMKNQLTTMR